MHYNYYTVRYYITRQLHRIAVCTEEPSKVCLQLTNRFQCIASSYSALDVYPLTCYTLQLLASVKLVLYHTQYFMCSISTLVAWFSIDRKTLETHTTVLQLTTHQTFEGNTIPCELGRFFLFLPGNKINFGLVKV